jgi:hypothetical protein
MKALIFLTLISSSAVAQTPTFEFVWHRKYGGNTQVLRYKLKNNDSQRALEDAVFFCMNHFQKLSELSGEEKLDLIDVCVNPKIVK